MAERMKTEIQLSLPTDEEIAEMRAGCYLPGIAEFEATDVARLLDFAERARRLLRDEEWTEHGDMGDPPTCFRCHRDKIEGHASGCELAALIGAK